MTWKHGDRSGGHGDRKGRHYDTTFVARFSVYSSGDPCGRHAHPGGRHVSTLAVALFPRGGRHVSTGRYVPSRRSLLPSTRGRFLGIHGAAHRISRQR